jgi:hypothetical protein
MPTPPVNKSRTTGTPTPIPMIIPLLELSATTTFLGSSAYGLSIIGPTVVLLLGAVGI